eukprot:scaffold237874_cov27-Tisochrysis_lutea.AAC.3
MLGVIPSISDTTRSSSSVVAASLSGNEVASSPWRKEKSMRTASSSASAPVGSGGALSPSSVPVPTSPVGENDSLAMSSAIASDDGPAVARSLPRLRFDPPPSRVSGSASAASTGSATSSSRAL